MKRHAPLIATVLAAAVMLTCSATASAQTTSSRPIALFDGRYDATTRWTGGFGVVLPIGAPSFSSDLGGLRSDRGVEIEATAGTGGARLAIGGAQVSKQPGRGPILFGQDVLMSVVRTGHSPRGASEESTYLGFEGGLTVLMVRVSAGLAHRVAGTSGSHATIFTWSVGLQAGW